jgi:hypothetical protein
MSIDKSQNSYNREIELILYCSRTYLDEQTKAKIQSLVNESLDWEYIFATCLQHKVTPLVFNSLKKIDTQAIPPKILDKFSSFFKAITIENLSLASELLKILEIFKLEKIPVIPFKGVVLAASAYGDLALRHFGDLDMLIEENNISKAIEIFNKLGYPPPKQIVEIEEKPFLKFENFHESGYYKGAFDIIDRERQIALELHWTLFSKSFPFPVTFQDLWQRKDYVNIAGNKIPQFAAEDLLIYVCVHSSRHCWSCLNWICDVAELIRANPDLDWHQVENKASQWGCQRMLHMGLILAHKLLDTTLPTKIEQLIEQDRVANTLAENVAINLFNPLNTKYNQYAFLMNARERVKDKLVYSLNLLFAPTEEDWNYLSLPKYLHFIYYFTRPYRLLTSYLFRKA